MQISIVSGKGGAGKTTVATHLFLTSPGTVLIDCDVEEPDAALFLDILDEEEEVFTLRYPVIDESRCTNCGACASFCRFGAILSSKAVTIPLAGRCHDCGGCAMVCPADAVRYAERPAGRIVRSRTPGGLCTWGELNVGEYSGVKLIRRLRKDADPRLISWIDGPPGTSCQAVAATEDADYAVLVAEPTPFGLSDMKMAVEMLGSLEVPFGVVVNKAGPGGRRVQDFCRDSGFDVLGEIPFDRRIAEACAAGRSLPDLPGITGLHDGLSARILSSAGRGVS